jgi:hypothetical protein
MATVRHVDICDKQLIVGGAAGHAWDEDGVCRNCNGTSPDSHTAFAQRLESLINAHSQENGSDTPDFILAQYLLGCLAVWNDTVKRREKWYGREADSLRLNPQYAIGASPATPNAPQAPEEIG